MLVPSVVRIRSGRPPDAEEIARVYVDGWRTAYAGLLPNSVLIRMSEGAQARDWAQQLARRKYADSIVVAEVAERGLVGFGSCGAARRTYLPHAGEIYTLYVATDHQERGVGRALLMRLFDSLVDRGLNSAVVWVLAMNQSRFFYEAMGGRRVAEKLERLWNTDLAQTAYGWDDLRLAMSLRDTDGS